MGGGGVNPLRTDDNFSHIRKVFGFTPQIFCGLIALCNLRGLKAAKPFGKSRFFVSKSSLKMILGLHTVRKGLSDWDYYIEFLIQLCAKAMELLKNIGNCAHRLDFIKIV